MVIHTTLRGSTLEEEEEEEGDTVGCGAGETARHSRWIDDVEEEEKAEEGTQGRQRRSNDRDTDPTVGKCREAIQAQHNAREKQEECGGGLFGGESRKKKTKHKQSINDRPGRSMLSYRTKERGGGELNWFTRNWR